MVRPPRGGLLLAAVALGLVTLAVFAPVRHHAFVNYDDTLYVTDNPRVQAGLTLDNVRWAFTTGTASNWHPLTWLSHMLDYQLFGLDAGRHHLTSLALHILNALLLLLVLHAMTGALWRSAWVAAMFAVHPLHVEAVAYVAQRKDVLSTLFWLLTMAAYAHYASRPSRRRYGLVALCFALGLMAKPMLVTLPFVLLLLDVWPLARWEGTRAHAGALLVEKVPLLALSAAASAVTFVVQARGGSVGSLTAYPLPTRLANALMAYVAYLRKALWPVDLAAFYPYPHAFPPWQLVGGAALLLGVISWVALQSVRRAPYLLVGWLWFLGTLVPVIGIVQVGTQAMADRYTYVPLIGLLIMVAWGAPDLLAWWRRGPTTAHADDGIALPAFATLVVAVCALASRIQVGYWHDSTTLFSHALAVTPDNYLAHNNLGLTLQREGKLDEAAAHLTEALRIVPDYVDAHFNLGITLTHQGRLADAVAQYQEVLRRAPNHARALCNLGAVLREQGKLGTAIAFFDRALELDPALVEAHVGLGAALREEGDLAGAIAQYADALRLAPANAEAHNNLGNVLAQQGKLDEATSHYLAALAAMPDFAEAHYNLGNARAEGGDLATAIDEFSAAIRLRPDYADAYAHRARAHALRRESEAAEADRARAQALGAQDPAGR